MRRKLINPIVGFRCRRCGKYVRQRIDPEVGKVCKMCVITEKAVKAVLAVLLVLIVAFMFVVILV